MKIPVYWCFEDNAWSLKTKMGFEEITIALLIQLHSDQWMCISPLMYDAFPTLDIAKDSIERWLKVSK